MSITTELTTSTTHPTSKATSSTRSPHRATSDTMSTPRLQFPGLGYFDMSRSQARPMPIPTAARIVIPQVASENAATCSEESMSQRILCMCKETRSARAQPREASSTSAGVEIEKDSAVEDDCSGSSHTEKSNDSTLKKNITASSSSTLTNSSDEGVVTDTERTSNDTSSFAKLQLEVVGTHVVDMTEHIRQMVEDCTTRKLAVEKRNSDLEARNAQLQAANEELEAAKFRLEERQKKTNDLRRDDYRKITEYAEANQNLSEEYDEMKQELTDGMTIESVKIITLRKLNQRQTKSHEAEVAKLRGCLDVEETKVQNMDTAITFKDRELMELRQIVKTQDVELSKRSDVIKEKDTEIDEMKGLYREEKKQFIESSNVCRKALEAQCETLSSQVRLVNADIDELRRKDEAEIMRVTMKFYTADELNKALRQQLSLGNVTAEQLRQCAQSYSKLVTEIDMVIKERDCFREQLEGVLDNELQSQAHITAYLQKARDAQHQFSRAEQEIAELKMKLAGKVEANILEENDILRKRNYELVEENEGLREKFSKAEDEIFKHDIQESLDLIEKAKVHKTIENSFKTIANLQAEVQSFGLKLQELEAGDQAKEADREIMQRLHSLSHENQLLREAQTPLQEQLEANQNELRNTRKKLSNLEDRENWWRDLYYDELIGPMEQLHDELERLKKEKGESHYITSSHPFNKAVAERNAQRLLCMGRLVHREECSDPELLEMWDKPGAIKATEYALKKLRPLGWIPIREMGQMWMAPAVKPFTEKDALERIEAIGNVDRKALHTNLGLPNHVDTPNVGVIGSRRPSVAPAIPQWDPTGAGAHIRPPPGLGFSKHSEYGVIGGGPASKRKLGGQSKFLGGVIPVAP